MARLVFFALLAVLSLTISSVASSNDNHWKRDLKRYWRQSEDNRDEGDAPNGGASFQVVDVGDLGPEGDGVMSRACMNHWMRFAINVNILAGNEVPTNFCPFGPYGAAIVDAFDTSAENVHINGDNCGKLLETNSGLREVNLRNPAAHSEINALFRLTDCTLHPEDCNELGHYRNAQNKTFWQRLYLFTTAASCPADAASEILAGIRKVIQSVTIKDLLEWNWTQSSFIEPELIYASQRQLNGVNTLIRGVERQWMKQYFNWQFTNVAHGCPTGCSVSTNPTTGARTCVNTPSP